MFWWKLSFGLKTAPPIIWFSAPGFFHRKSRLVRHERLCQVLRILMQAPNCNRCTTQSMKVKSCHALGRRLWKVFCLCSCPIGHWVRRSVFGRKHNCQFFWAKSAPVFFDVALHSINSIGEWWFNWQDPSIEGHTNEKPSIQIWQRIHIHKTSKTTRIALCRNFWYLMSPCRNASYWGIFGWKLQTTIPLSWLRHQSVKFDQNSGSSEFRFKR